MGSPSTEVVLVDVASVETVPVLAEVSGGGLLPGVVVDEVPHSGRGACWHGPMAGHTHAHDSDESLELPDTTARVVRVVAIAMAVLTVVGIVVLWPDGAGQEAFIDSGFTRDYYDAEVVEVTEAPCPNVPEGFSTSEPICATYRVRILEGPDEGLELDQEVYDIAAGTRFSVGEVLVLAYDASVAELELVPGQELPEGAEYSIKDRDRKADLLWLALLFAVVVVVLGRLRGLAALAGLVATVVLLLAFTLPAIIDGRNALAVAVVSAAAIAFCAIYLAHGVSLMTTVAVLGTLGALLLTALLGWLFTATTRLTGFANEEATFLAVGSAEISISGLVLAGIVIGALGAIDDMTVTQVASVVELHRANDDYGFRELYSAANRIGQDHVASTVNTLVLAYAGASMPLLVLLAVTEQPLVSVANSEIIATEIVRTLVGSIGLVAAVPITTLLACAVVRRSAPEVERVLG